MGIMQTELYGGLYVGHAPTAAQFITRESQIRLHFLGCQHLQLLLQEILCRGFRLKRNRMWPHSSKQQVKNSIKSQSHDLETSLSVMH